MPNPYAPRWPRERRPMREVLPTLDGFVERLRLLGAEQSTIDVVRERWDVVDEEDRADRDDVLRLNDEDLQALILEVEEEHRLGTTTDEEEAAQRFTAAVATLADVAAEADQWVAGTVSAVIEIVGDDQVAAAAALLAEYERAKDAEEEPRVTLTEKLISVAGEEWVVVVNALLVLEPEPPAADGEHEGDEGPADGAG